MTVSRQALIEALSHLTDPISGKSVVSLGMLGAIETSGEAVSVEFKIQNPSYSGRPALESEVDRIVKELGGERSRVTWTEAGGPAPTDEDPVPGVRNVVLVMSGKGGVGKSTVCTNLALAVSRMGMRVGLLDADLYGPSIPTMLGINGRPRSTGSRIEPLERFGIKLMSIGFLLEDPKAAVVWRGPMLHGALLQFLRDVDWGALDYLFLDLPPGTGDVALTLAQRLKTTGAVVVTTPQEVALQDVYKSVSMAQKVGIPILGVVENNSYFVCDGCTKRHELLGAGGGAKIADMAEAPLLGQIPMIPAVREWGDAGTPIVQASPGSEAAKAFVEVATRLVETVEKSASRQQTLSIDRSGGTNRRLPITR